MQYEPDPIRRRAMTVALLERARDQLLAVLALAGGKLPANSARTSQPPDAVTTPPSSYSSADDAHTTLLDKPGEQACNNVDLSSNGPDDEDDEPSQLRPPPPRVKPAPRPIAPKKLVTDPARFLSSGARTTPPPAD